MECTHKNLKHYINGNKVICLDCGETWGGETYDQFPSIPYTPPVPMLEYPTYPVVTWCKTIDSTGSNLDIK